MDVPDNHPRAHSLKIRELVIDGMHKNIVAEAGLIAHGRGEAFDYLLGEETIKVASKQQRAAVALLIIAKKPIISVNGNVAALCSNEIVKLSEILDVPLEVNLFYRREERVNIVAKKLKEAGAKNVFGVDKEFLTSIPELSHSRRIVDKRGIFIADVVFVPLEDGDRTMALRKMDKEVIAIDLNPLSRTSIWSSITIVNNIVRAIPEMIEIASELKDMKSDELTRIVKSFNNNEALRESLEYISNRLIQLSKGKIEVVL